MRDIPMGSNAKEPKDLLGQVIAGYQLEREIGRGLTGAVYAGRRLETTTQVVEQTAAAPLVLPDQAAIKVLLPPRQASEEEERQFRARFLREAQTLRELHHPHIVPILASGDDDGYL